MPRRRFSRRLPAANGFTLVELLVVVAIVGLLAALLLPSLKNALSRASSEKCASNLSQIGGACLLYAAEHDGQLPPSFVTEPSGTVDVCTTILAAYLPVPTGQGNSVWFCPAAQGPRAWANTRPDYSPNERDVPASTPGIIARQAYGVVLPNVRLSSIPSPGRVILFGDTFAGTTPSLGTSGYRMRSLGGETYFGGPLPATGMAPRHEYVASPTGGRFNAVFADGHVESFGWNDPRLQDATFRGTLVTP